MCLMMRQQCQCLLLRQQQQQQQLALLLVQRLPPLQHLLLHHHHHHSCLKLHERVSVQVQLPLSRAPPQCSYHLMPWRSHLLALLLGQGDPVWR
jgi:hypothetical protein